MRSPDETFAGADANDLGAIQNTTNPLGGETWVVDGQIEPQTYALEWPGGPDTPGVRSLPDQPQVADDSDLIPGVGVADASSTIPVFFYNFASEYNTAIPTERNEITAAQEQLVEDVFQLYGTYLGVKFEETYSPTPVKGEMTIATGDLSAVGGVSGDGVPALTEVTAEGAGEAVMDGSVDWGTNAYGGTYFTSAFTQIGYLLGYGYDDETPQLTNTAQDPTTILTPPENILPSPQDVAFGQYMYRTDSSAIDLYRFELPTSGTLNLETLAQQLQNSSTLSTYLELFNSQHQVIARNGEYFGTDSYISMANLPAGTYYVGVSASGNENYNPLVPLSGTGGTSQGPYELRISFAPSPAAPASLASASVANDNNIWLDSAANVPAGPATVLGDGNIALDNQSGVSVKFTAGTAPLSAGTDGTHPAIVTTSLTTASLSTLNGKTFELTKGTTVYTFQFIDASNSAAQVSTGDLALSFNSQTDTAGSLVAKIATRINDALWLTLTPGTAPFTAGIDDGHPAIITSNFTTASISTLAGETFQVNKGTNTYTFEFVDLSNPSGEYGQAAQGDLALAFNSQTDTVSSILGDIVAAINNAVSNLVDTTATPLDGDDDGIPGGQYNDWFNVQDAANSIYVDKVASAATASGDTGTIGNPYTTINAAFLAAAPGDVVRIEGNNTANVNNGNTIIAVPANTNASTPLIQNGDTFTIFDGLQTLTFEFERVATALTPGDVDVAIASTYTAQQVAQAIAAAINSVSVTTTGLANGLHASAAVVQNATTLQWEVSVTGPGRHRESRPTGEKRSLDEHAAGGRSLRDRH